MNLSLKSNQNNDVIIDFKALDSIKKWEIIDDTVMGGLSI